MALERRRDAYPVGQSDRGRDLRRRLAGWRSRYPFEPTSGAAQIVRLAGTLPQGGAPRLERLRGFGASFGGTLICLCSRIMLADNSAGVLVVSTERAGNDLSLPERARRLLADFEQPAAIFTADGELIEAARRGARTLRRQPRPDRARRRETGARGQPQRPGRRRDRGRTGHACCGSAPARPSTLLLPSIARASGSHAGARASDRRAAIAARPRQPGRADTRAAPACRSAFVWQMDAATRFTLGAEDFAAPDRTEDRRRAQPSVGGDRGRAQARSAGPHRRGAGLARHLERHRRALAGRRRETSGWPIEMSGLPVFDRDRQFDGYPRLRHLPRPATPDGRSTAARRSRPRQAQTNRRQGRLAFRSRRPAATGAGAGSGAEPRRTQRLRGTGARTQRAAEKYRRQDPRRRHAGRFRRRAIDAAPQHQRPSLRRRRRGPRATATPRATPTKAGRSSIACRSAFWSIGSTI